MLKVSGKNLRWEIANLWTLHWKKASSSQSMTLQRSLIVDANAVYSKGKGKFKPLTFNHCGNLVYIEDRCFKKSAKQQHKDHANLDGAAINED